MNSLADAFGGALRGLPVRIDTFSAGALLADEYQPWTSLSRIVRGTIQMMLVSVRDGRGLLLARFESGERLPCWHTHPDIRIEAVTDVALESISCSALFAMARNNDALRLALLRAASDDERMFIGIMKRLHEPIEVRIVTYLLERPAQPAITRREIAAAAGTITDVSDRILRKLNRAQAIRYERGRIVDRSPARLQRYLGDVSSR